MNKNYSSVLTKTIFIVAFVVSASAVVLTQVKTNHVDQKNPLAKGTSMQKHATATFGITSWEEKPYSEIEGAPTLKRATVTKSYQGDIQGEGKLEYLMMYRSPTSASFKGLERVTGTVGGRTASFVLQHIGTFEGGVAKVTLTVVPGSGTGELRGLKGEGEFSVGHQPPYTMTLDYGFE
jgi:hypothetical protein